MINKITPIKFIPTKNLESNLSNMCDSWKQFKNKVRVEENVSVYIAVGCDKCDGRDYQCKSYSSQLSKFNNGSRR